MKQKHSITVISSSVKRH